MLKHQQAESTYLVTMEQAGLDILYALMFADGRADDREFSIIEEYLKTDLIRKSALFNDKHTFYHESNFNKEYSYLKTLDQAALLRRYKKAVQSFNNLVIEHPEDKKLRDDLFQFALKLVKADGNVTIEEENLLGILKTEWKIQ